MQLNVRDSRAAELAKTLAAWRGTSMTEAVIAALEIALEQERKRLPLAERFASIAAALAAKGKPGGRDLTKEEIDELWGH